MSGVLIGKVAAVTGASHGIGRPISQALVASGARVALFTRSSTQLDATQREPGDASIAVLCEVSDPASVRRAFAAIVEQWGRLDILISNVAVCQLQKVKNAEDDDLRREIDMSLLGPIFCDCDVISYLTAAGGGDIFNISIESTSLPFPYFTVYAATKGG